MANTDRFIFKKADDNMSDKVSEAFNAFTREQLLRGVRPILISEEYGDELKMHNPDTIISGYMNMCIKYIFPLSSESFNEVFVTVNKGILKKHQISETELQEYAFDNLKNIPLYIEDINAMISKMTGEQCEGKKILLSANEALPHLKAGMYTITNEDDLYGANVLMDVPMLGKIADAFDSDIYILPSSIHEVLVIPAALRECIEDFDTMVSSVNESYVTPKEQLSDKPYYYRRRDKALKLVD